jgi:selenocysteine lyase/cysteine desulfurase
MPTSRREFVSTLAAGSGALWLAPGARASTAVAGSAFEAAVAAGGRVAATFQHASDDPEACARNADLWRDVQGAWAVDRSILNMENGGMHPTPAAVTKAMFDSWLYANEAPSYTQSRVQWPQLESVRTRLASAFGCDPEELAVTRNSTEGFLSAALGIKLAAGDEVLTTTQDYHRFRNDLHQREQREGIVLKAVPLPIPAEDPSVVVQRFAEGITPRTRVILMPHVINLTGQFLPVRQVVQMARAKGVLVIVDGAHSFAHVPFRRDDLDCDIYVTSLHKWLAAPYGTGFLYVRRALIPSIWPLFPPTARAPEDIRKFEAIGSAPAAPFLAIRDALDFWQAIGAARKAARLRYLRERWLAKVAAVPGVIVHSTRIPALSGAIANIELEGIPPPKLATWLWEKHRALVGAIDHPEFKGIRVVPSLYTTEAEADRFADLILTARRQGI